MSVARRLSRIVGDASYPSSLAARSRRGRWAEFAARFPDVSQLTVLDLGGRSAFWRDAPVRPAHVTLLNLDDDLAPEPWMTVVRGDACRPPAQVPSRVDLVVSNSLIEHVGGHFQRLLLADVVHERSDRHWVQTPYRYFPVEPHWVAPGMQFLPFRVRVEVSRRWPMGHYASGDPARAVDTVAEVELLSKTEMMRYFPDSTIWWDRFLGAPKSMVAVRSA